MVGLMDKLGLRSKKNKFPVTPYKTPTRDVHSDSLFTHPPPPTGPAPKPPTIQELPQSPMSLSGYVNVETQPQYINSHLDPYTSRLARESMAYSPPPVSPTKQIVPGDLPLYRARGQRVTPDELRELREQIRQRYELDVELWGMRYYRERDRDVVEKAIRRADALLDKIRRTAVSYDKPEFWDLYTQDYERFREIKGRICSPGKRHWATHPPWEEQSIGTRLF